MGLNAHLLPALGQLVLAHYTGIGHTECHALRNVVVAEKEYFKGIIGSFYKQRALGWPHFDAGFGKEIHAVVVEAPF